MSLSKFQIGAIGTGAICFGLFIWEHLARKRDERRKANAEANAKANAEANAKANAEANAKSEQHINLTPKPSQGFGYVAQKGQDFFSWTGKGFAKLSSFYTYIELDEFYKTGHDLVKPAAKIVVSPAYTIKGYFDEMKTYQRRRWLIVLGTATIGGTAYVVCKYFDIPIGQTFKTFVNNNWAKLTEKTNSKMFIHP